MKAKKELLPNFNLCSTLKLKGFKKKRINPGIKFTSKKTAKKSAKHKKINKALKYTICVFCNEL